MNKPINKAIERFVRRIDKRHQVESTLSGLSFLLSFYIAQSSNQDIQDYVSKMLLQLVEYDNCIDHSYVFCNPNCTCSFCISHVLDVTINTNMGSNQIVQQVIHQWKSFFLSISQLPDYLLRLQQAFELMKHVTQQCRCSHCGLLLACLWIELLHLMSTNDALEFVECFWNDTSVMIGVSLLSCVLAHLSSLSQSLVLQIIIQMLSDTNRIDEYSLQCIIHIVCITLSNSTVSPDPQSIVTIAELLASVPDSKLASLPPLYRSTISQYLFMHTRKPYCCSRWAAHHCNSCRQLLSQYNPFACAPHACPICYADAQSISSSFHYLYHSPDSLIRACEWESGSNHICPVCKYDCCEKDKLGCYCLTGSYSCCFQYDDSSSSSESIVLYSKKREGTSLVSYSEMERMKKMIKLDYRYSTALGFDVMLRIFQFLPSFDLVQLQLVSTAFKRMVEHDCIWKLRYLSLYQHIHCCHSPYYHHRYYHLFRKRVKRFKMKTNQRLCDYCGCNYMFASLVDYAGHIQEKHKI